MPRHPDHKGTSRTSARSPDYTLSKKPENRLKEKISMLKENQKQLQQALASADMAIWEWDVKTGKVKWSDSIYKIFGLTDKRSLKNNFEFFVSYIHPDDRTFVIDTIRRTSETNRDFNMEYRIVQPDGSIRWTECTGRVIRTRNRTTKLTGVLHDVTARKKIEQEREDWKVRHELVAAAAGLVIYDYDIASGNILWSGTIEEVLGYKPHELGNIDRWVDLIHPDDRDEAFRLLEIAERNLAPYDVNYRFSQKNGGYCIMHDRGFFMADNNLKATRMLGIMNDVTLQKKTEQELIASEQRFRTLQKASFGGIGLHDKGVILDCNQGLCNITGYDYRELIGMDGLLLIAPEWRNLVRNNILSGYEKPYDAEGLRKDGSRYFLEINGKNIPYKGKTIRVTEFRDITDRKLAEAQILEQNAKLVAITEDLKSRNEQLKEFTQIVSHNLRSPVGNILSLLSFFETTENEEERKEFLTHLKDAGNSILTTLHELNEVLQIKQNKNIERQTLKFATVLEQVCRMLNAKIAEAGAHVINDFSEAPEVEYPHIYLESIFLNLLSNALKYRHPDRNPVITFSTFFENNSVVLKVSDNGMGLNLDRYGHQVFKLRKTFHRHPESRGIGLFMIKNQIEAMGGEISLTSVENEGSAFIVKFTKA